MFKKDNKLDLNDFIKRLQNDYDSLSKQKNGINIDNITSIQIHNIIKEYDKFLKKINEGIKLVDNEIKSSVDKEINEIKKQKLDKEQRELKLNVNNLTTRYQKINKPKLDTILEFEKKFKIDYAYLSEIKENVELYDQILKDYNLFHTFIDEVEKFVKSIVNSKPDINYIQEVKSFKDKLIVTENDLETLFNSEKKYYQNIYAFKIANNKKKKISNIKKINEDNENNLKNINEIYKVNKESLKKWIKAINDIYDALENIVHNEISKINNEISKSNKKIENIKIEIEDLQNSKKKDKSKTIRNINSKQDQINEYMDLIDELEFKKNIIRETDENKKKLIEDYNKKRKKEKEDRLLKILEKETIEIEEEQKLKESEDKELAKALEDLKLEHNFKMIHWRKELENNNKYLLLQAKEMFMNSIIEYKTNKINLATLISVIIYMISFIVTKIRILKKMAFEEKWEVDSNYLDENKVSNFLNELSNEINEISKSDEYNKEELIEIINEKFDEIIYNKQKKKEKIKDIIKTKKEKNVIVTFILDLLNMVKKKIITDYEDDFDNIEILRVISNQNKVKKRCAKYIKTNNVTSYLDNMKEETFLNKKTLLKLESDNLNIKEYRNRYEILNNTDKTISESKSKIDVKWIENNMDKNIIIYKK